jgi:hypothetical protein
MDIGMRPPLAAQARPEYFLAVGACRLPANPRRLAVQALLITRSFEG